MEIGLKERLIGAVVLVILGVIIIPFFLKSSPSPDTGVNQAVTLPPGDTTSVQQVSMPLTPGPAATTTPLMTAARPATAPAPAAVSSPKPVVHNITRIASAPAPASGQWLVQAGSYGSQANADKVVKTLQQHGFHASVSRFSIAAPSTNTATETTTNPPTNPPLNVPAGKARIAVRGFAASSRASTSRLNAIAADRAATMQTTIQLSTRNVGQPPAASTAPVNANGSANTECSHLIISSVTTVLLHNDVIPLS